MIKSSIFRDYREVPGLMIRALSGNRSGINIIVSVKAIAVQLKEIHQLTRYIDNSIMMIQIPGV
jgi:hypothetical protein